jgi:hypothetical protein
VSSATVLRSLWFVYCYAKCRYKEHCWAVCCYKEGYWAECRYIEHHWAVCRYKERRWGVCRYKEHHWADCCYKECHECHSKERHWAECRYKVRRWAECCSAFLKCLEMPEGLKLNLCFSANRIESAKPPFPCLCNLILILLWLAMARNPHLKGRIGTIDLLALTSSDKLLFILKIYFFFSGSNLSWWGGYLYWPLPFSKGSLVLVSDWFPGKLVRLSSFAILHSKCLSCIQPANRVLNLAQVWPGYS